MYKCIQENKFQLKIYFILYVYVLIEQPYSDINVTYLLNSPYGKVNVMRPY